MLDGKHKSIEPMAARIPDGDQQCPQQFVNLAGRSIHAYLANGRPLPPLTRLESRRPGARCDANRGSAAASQSRFGGDREGCCCELP
jgi:hypothetical protein